MARLWFITGAGFGLIGVALSAIAAHASLVIDTPAMHEAMRAAATLILAHAGALIAIATWQRAAPNPKIDAATAMIAAGVVIFTFAIAIHAFAGLKIPGMAPIGGSLTMLGWFTLAIAGALAP